MKKYDLVIVGGGMVGLSLAALLKDINISIAVIEQKEPYIDETTITNRVSALNVKSRVMLEKLGAWEQIDITRKSPYEQMYVWEKDSNAKLHFSKDDFAATKRAIDELGFIVENNHIQMGLWKVVSGQKNVEIIKSRPKSSVIDEDNAILNLENGDIIIAKLIVGADGVNSWVRNFHNFPLTERDYGHSALVATIRTALPHNKTAWQIFDPKTILAFLPLNDPHLCSIVWSQPPLMAEQNKLSSIEEFNKALTVAFDNRLGACEIIDERGVYPLRARYSRDFAKNRLALIGDAAHTIHPLAGLGVNLGFSDAIKLSEEIISNVQSGNDIGKLEHLRNFERARKLEALKTLTMMQSVHFAFSGDNLVKKLIRNVALNTTDRLNVIKNFFLANALDL